MNDLPEILQPLAKTPCSGQLIALSLSDKRYQYILANYGFMKPVQLYTHELRAFITAREEKTEAPREHDLTTARVCQRKSEMITAVLAFHKVQRVGSPAWFRDRVATLEKENEALRHALRCANVSEPAFLYPA